MTVPGSSWTVLSWHLDLDRLAAEARRCAEFETFFDASAQGIPITTTEVAGRRERRPGLSADDGSEGESQQHIVFQNVGNLGLFGMAFPTRIRIAVKAELPQTFWRLSPNKPQRCSELSGH